MCQQVFLLKASFEAIFNFEQESFHIRKLGALEHWSWWLGNCGTDTIFIKEQNSIDLSLNIQPRNYLLASIFRIIRSDRSPLRYDAQHTIDAQQRPFCWIYTHPRSVFPNNYSVTNATRSNLKRPLLELAFLFKEEDNLWRPLTILRTIVHLGRRGFPSIVNCKSICKISEW